MAFIAALAVIIPLALTAADSEHIDKPVRHELALSILPMFQDSTAAKKKPEKKAPPPKKDAKAEEKKAETKKAETKEEVKGE